MSTLYIYLNDVTPTTDVFTSLNQIGGITAISDSSAISDSVLMLRSHTINVKDSTAVTSTSPNFTVSLPLTLSVYETAKAAELSAWNTWQASLTKTDWTTWQAAVVTLQNTLQLDANAQAASAGVLVGVE